MDFHVKCLPTEFRPSNLTRYALFNPFSST
ncbi:hypothetical protein BOSEA1005_11375 [Hyphomicrobiales bacterium]|nr:hypothetical protein BOSEA1005_11375 [Hyphomicrobiales bacterium]CAI0341982.1 hypothetical protein BO1005MUT1_120008 [Hyphomicrobiales bacterium]